MDLYLQIHKKSHLLPLSPLKYLRTRLTLCSKLLQEKENCCKSVDGIQELQIIRYQLSNNSVNHLRPK